MPQRDSSRPCGALGMTVSFWVAPIAPRETRGISEMLSDVAAQHDNLCVNTGVPLFEPHNFMPCHDQLSLPVSSNPPTNQHRLAL